MGFSLVSWLLFRNLDFVKNNFETVILAIIGLSLCQLKLFGVNIKTAGNSV
jgi:hypothetical protein